jgi:hypothetical protein
VVAERGGTVVASLLISNTEYKVLATVRDFPAVLVVDKAILVKASASLPAVNLGFLKAKLEHFVSLIVESQ